MTRIAPITIACLLLLLAAAAVWADADKDKEAKGNLGALRAGLTLYYGDHDGKYPATLDALIPCCASAIPTIEVGGHAATNKVTIVDKMPPAAKVPDSGGWLYHPGTGRVVIDCKHKDPATKKPYADQ